MRGREAIEAIIRGELPYEVCAIEDYNRKYGLECAYAGIEIPLEHFTDNAFDALKRHGYKVIDVWMYMPGRYLFIVAKDGRLYLGGWTELWVPGEPYPVKLYFEIVPKMENPPYPPSEWEEKHRGKFREMPEGAGE